MRLLRRIAALILLPYRIVSQRLAPDGIDISVSGGLTQAARVRTYAAPVWRKWVRWTVVLTGLGIYALMQFSIAYFIGTWQWWYVAAFFVVAASTALAVTRPIVALIVWLVVSPLGKNFLRMELGWRVIPEITFDFMFIYSAALLLVARAFVNRPRTRKLIAAEWLMLGYIGYVGAGQVAAADPTVGGILRELSRTLLPEVLVIAVLYFVTKACIARKEHASWIAVAMAVFGLLMGLANCYEHVTGERWYSLIVGFGIPLRYRDIGMGRASGMFDHASAPAALIVTGFFLAYHLAGWSRRPAAKVLYYASIATISVGAFFTYTRNVYIVFALVALIMPLIATANRKRFAAIAIALLIIVAAMTPKLMENTEFYHRITKISTVQTRVALTGTALNVIRSNFLFGVGHGNLNKVQEAYASSMRVRQYRPGQLAPVQISHNTYLTILAEGGLFGFLLYFGAVAAFLMRLVRIRNKAPAESLVGKDLIAIFIASSLGFLVSIVAESMYLVPYVNYIFWMQFAVAVRLEELWEQGNKVPAVTTGVPPQPALAVGTHP